MDQQSSTVHQEQEDDRGYFSELAHHAWERITDSRETKSYAIVALISTIVCIVLEALVASAYTDAFNKVLASDIAAGGSPSVSSAFGDGSSDSDDPYYDVLLSLKQVKDENVFFVLFHLFQIYLGYDAIVRQSVIQLIAHTFNEFLSIIFALIQLGETLKWRGAVANVDHQVKVTTNTIDLLNSLHYEIGLAVALAVLTCIFAYLCRMLLLQFGWSTYKRLGADIQLQARYRLAQIFLLFLKLDAFFHIVFCIFWIVVMTQEGYYRHNAPGLAWYIIHLVLTVAQIPTFFAARYAIREEKHNVMYGFLLVHFLLIVDFIVVLQQSAGSWIFWVLAVCWAILLSLITVALGAKVIKNFDMGLKPHLRQKEQDKTNALGPKEEDWVIDEE
ncbi:hypothetical protein DM01DRAFT_1409940 [Hesseltinella vesiculosa]|uniref:Uncharacterized protein n=1 Tax=Hesseltinella vesiculosa TaxID=101127 RepID=A0A1X2G9A9_9FUNG|nr:hypothetical protein DM01DRAFT_1409940 [Hesseltinella vesiculosa]